MNSTLNNSAAPIPVGFRFHPTDEELVGYYLHGKVGRAQRDQLIQELDLYKIEPWDLHEVCRIGDDAAETQSDWYFFSHKDKKYPTGNRANRATTAGFWKATGRDKPIHTQRHVIGMRKTLVFYKGRAPHGQKTDWIMHEFRLDEGPGVVPNYESDGWVVCRVFRKTKNFKTSKSQDDNTSCSFEESDQQHHQQLQQQLPSELLSPPVVVSKLMTIFNGPSNSHVSDLHQQHHHHPAGSSYNNNNFQCKQELSIDDYGTTHHDTFDQLQASIHHHHLDHHHLAPCSSSTFRELCNHRPFDPPTSAEAPFPGDQSAYWMQLSEGAKSGTRRDQTLADITCHVGRMKRQATTDLVHLWNV